MPKPLLWTPITFTINRRTVTGPAWDRRNNIRRTRSRKPDGYTFPPDPVLPGENIFQGITGGA